jgi:hypothetical protein
MQWEQVSNCLGEAAYGAPTDLRFAAAFPPMLCSNPSMLPGLRWDNAEIVYDPSCPGIGEVKNGNLETGDGTGWTLGGWGSGIAEADVAGIGVGNSYGARLYMDMRCSSATMSTTMSVPTLATMANPALSFQINQTAGWPADFWIDSSTELVLYGNGSFGEIRVCLPHTLSGAAHEVGFHISASGTCAQAIGPITVVVDDMALVNDPTCAFANGMVDPGVEMSATDALRRAWYVEVFDANEDSNPVAETLNNTAQARTGDGSIHLLLEQRCDSASAANWFTVPQPAGGNGPAVVFYYRYPTSVATGLSFYVDPFSFGTEAVTELIGVPTAAAYTRQVMCIPSIMSGRPAMFQAMLYASGTCAQNFAPEEAWLDDFEITTDSSCPP